MHAIDPGWRVVQAVLESRSRPRRDIFHGFIDQLVIPWVFCESSLLSLIDGRFLVTSLLENFRNRIIYG